MSGFLLSSCFHFCDLAFGFDAAGTSFYSVAVLSAGPLKVGLKPFNRCAHAVRSLNGSGVSLAANGAHSWHMDKM